MVIGRLFSDFSLGSWLGSYCSSVLCLECVVGVLRKCGDISVRKRVVVSGLFCVYRVFIFSVNFDLGEYSR